MGLDFVIMVSDLLVDTGLTDCLEREEGLTGRTVGRLAFVAFLGVLEADEGLRDVEILDAGFSAPP